MAVVERPAPGAVVSLWPAREDAADAVAELFLLADAAPAATVVVCPGGGYWGHAIEPEGYEVARWLNARGMHAVLVRYRTWEAGHRHPAPIDDARRALRLVRHHADEWGVDAGRIGLIGFSAGGHVAGTAAARPLPADPDTGDEVDRQPVEVALMALVYPVVSLVDASTHLQVRENLLGPEPDEALYADLSVELLVTPATPPTFLVTAHDDAMISSVQSALLYLALARAGVPAEFHSYASGPHGFGLGTGHPVVDDWPRHLHRWLAERGFCSPPGAPT